MYLGSYMSREDNLNDNFAYVVDAIPNMAPRFIGQIHIYHHSGTLYDVYMGVDPSIVAGWIVIAVDKTLV